MKNTLFTIIATASLFTTACSKPSSEQMKTMRERVHQADETNDQIKNLLREAWINNILGIDYTKPLWSFLTKQWRKQENIVSNRKNTTIVSELLTILKLTTTYLKKHLSPTKFCRSGLNKNQPKQL